MKLYYSTGACSLAVRMIINEIGIACEFESVDKKTKQTASGKDYRAINPKGAVPALELDDGQILTENAVIQQYLADTFQATQLLPPVGNFQRYRVLEWLNFISSDLHKSCGPFFNAEIPEALKINIFKPLLKKKLNIVDNALAKDKFLLGDAFTLPDAYLFVILRWMPHIKLDISDLKNINRYQGELIQRPAIQQSLADEHLLDS